MSIEIKYFDVEEPDFSSEFEKLAKEGQQRMINSVQKRSNNTARNIDIRVSPRGYEIFGAKKSYAVWHLLEYGTPKHSAYPFVRPVAKILAQKNEEAIKNVIIKGVKLK